MKNIIDILSEAGYDTSDLSNRKKVVQQINAVLKKGVNIQIAKKGQVWRSEGEFPTRKWNITVSGFGIRTKGYQHNVEPYDILNVCAVYLKNEKVKEQIKSQVSEPCTCRKCNGTGFIPAFAWYANGVCFDCGGIGIVGKTEISIKAKAEIEKIDPMQISDYETLFNIIFVNSQPHLVDGVRQAAFIRCCHLGYITEVFGNFNKQECNHSGDRLRDDVDEKTPVAYKFNQKLRNEDFWYSKDLDKIFIGIV